MKSPVALTLVSLLLLGTGAGCAADPPRSVETTPATAPPAPRPARVLLPPPPSAYLGALSVWDRVQESGGEGLRLRRLQSRTVSGQDDRPDRVHVVLDFVVVGSDAIQATAVYVALLDDLSASSWCENVQRAPTRTLEEEGALEVIGLEVLLRPDATSEVDLADDEDPELIARTIAAEVELGGLDARITTRQPERGVTDTIYHVRPSDRRKAFLLAEILAFLTPLEEDTKSMSLTGVELKTLRRTRVAEVLDEWTFQVQLTSRSTAKP